MEEGLSLSDIWKYIMRKKILASILFGGITILLFILILFAYNPVAGRYEATFNYNWYGIENNKFANGKVFNYYDIISIDNVREVKRSDEKFQNIDVNDAIDQLDIRLKDNIYTIYLKKSLLHNKDLDKEFLFNLITMPYKEALNIEFDFSSNFLGYAAANKIATKLDFLQSQIDMLKSGYSGMISYYGDVALPQKNLSNFYKEFDAFVSNNKISEFRYLAFKNSHMTKEEYKSIVQQTIALESEQELLRTRKESLLTSLRNIYESSNGNTYMDTAIANYLNSLHNLDSRLMKINEDLTLMKNANAGSYDEAESEAFLKEIETYKSEIDAFTKTYKENVQEVLKKNTILNIISFEEYGRISIIFAILISIIFGILCSLFLTFLVSYFSSKKQRNHLL